MSSTQAYVEVVAEKYIQRAISIIEDNQPSIRDFILDCTPIQGSIKKGFEACRAWEDPDTGVIRFGIKLLDCGFSVFLDLCMLASGFSALSGVCQNFGLKAVANATKQMLWTACVYNGTKIIANATFKLINFGVTCLELHLANKKIETLEEEVVTGKRKLKRATEQMEEECRKRQKVEEESKKDKHKIEQLQKEVEMLKKEKKEDDNWVVLC